MSNHVTHHEALLNAVLVIDDFGDGRQAIGGAGGIAVTTEMENNALSCGNTVFKTTTYCTTFPKGKDFFCDVRFHS